MSDGPGHVASVTQLEELPADRRLSAGSVIHKILLQSSPAWRSAAGGDTGVGYLPIALCVSQGFTTEQTKVISTCIGQALKMIGLNGAPRAELSVKLANPFYYIP